MSKSIFDVVTEDPEEPHVAAEVQQPAMKKHGGDQAEKHDLVWESAWAVLVIHARGGLTSVEGGVYLRLTEWFGGLNLARDGRVLKIEE